MPRPPRLLYSFKCLDVAGPSVANGAKVQQWDCVYVDNQEWRLLRPSSFQSARGGVLLQSVFSGKCLDLTDWSLANNTILQQWDCADHANKMWYFTPP